MITITVVLLIVAFLCAVLSLIGVASRVDLNSIAIILVCAALLIGSLH
jgi:hypothetical protein